MTFTHLIVLLTLNGGMQPVQVGTFSSLAVCEAERVALLTRLARPAAAPAGPSYAYSIVCARKT